MRAPGLLAIALVLLAAPLTVACYPQRIESCRGPMTDFSPFTNVSIPDAMTQFGGAEQVVPSVSYTIRAATTVSGTSQRCVSVHSELSSAGRVIETIDTPLRATISGGTLVTTPMFHYARGGPPLTLHVTALGATLDVPVLTPGAFRDVGVFADAGLFGDASR